MSFAQIMQFWDDQRDKMADAVKRRDKDAYSKIYRWYKQSLEVGDFSTPYRAEMNAIINKAGKVPMSEWK